MSTPAFFVIAFICMASASKCPDEDQQFFPHPTVCKKFFESDNGQMVERECFGDLVFNPATSMCDFAGNVDCEDVPNDAKLEGPVGKCPAENGIHVDFLTDAARCSVFYMCNWGAPIRMDCPDGLHFNPKLNVCDHPHTAGCTAGQ